MQDFVPPRFPKAFDALSAATRLLGFTMASDVWTGQLLRTLSASKPGGAFLELGTGTGLSTSWILDGMSPTSLLISVDNDPACLSLARKELGSDPRLTLELMDGAEWIEANGEKRFDFIFADTWHGKFLMREPVLEMLRPGGLYIIDDLLPQPNWPQGHDQKVQALIRSLEERTDLWLTPLDWSTGIIIATRGRS